MLPLKWPTFFFCRLRNHDYDMAINLIISDNVIRQSLWRLAARTSRFLPPFVFVFVFFFSFCGYIAFVLRSTAIPALRIPVCTLYSKLTCRYRNFDVSVIYIMLIQQSTGIVIRGVTPALSLRCTSSWKLPNDSCTAGLRICTLLHDQPQSVG